MPLTRRRLQYLDCALRGLPRKDIAAELDVSPNTAKRQLELLYRHFGVHSHAELIAKLGSRFPGAVPRPPPDEPILYG